jgi:hypothetical protein
MSVVLTAHRVQLLPKLRESVLQTNFQQRGKNIRGIRLRTERETPSTKARKMFVSFFEGKRSTDESDCLVFRGKQIMIVIYWPSTVCQ